MNTYLTSFLVFLSFVAIAQSDNLSLRPDPTYPQLPEGYNFGEVTGVALRPNGHLLVFHRGPHPLLEFDRKGYFVREIGAECSPAPTVCR